MARSVAHSVALLLLLAACAAYGRHLSSITAQYIGCNGGSCSYIYSQTTDQGTGASSAIPLVADGIVTSGSYNGTFACFTQRIPDDLNIKIVGSAVSPSIIDSLDGGMTCVSSAPLFCDMSCCWVTGVADVSAKACNTLAAPASAPAAAVGPPAAAPAPGSVVCSMNGTCSIDGVALSTTGITTTGTASGLWACWTPPTKAPIATVLIGDLEWHLGNVVSPAGNMQCVSNDMISCDFKCCSSGGATSCKDA